MGRRGGRGGETPIMVVGFKVDVKVKSVGKEALGGSNDCGDGEEREAREWVRER